MVQEAGASANSDKLEHIVHIGWPTNQEDIRSLIQKAICNAKFTFDQGEDKTHEEVIIPLRQLITKDTKFDWKE